MGRKAQTEIMAIKKLESRTQRHVQKNSGEADVTVTA